MDEIYEWALISIKVFVIFKVCCFFGFFYGVFASFALFYAYKNIICFFYKIYPLDGTDIAFIGKTTKETIVGIAWLEIEDFDSSKLKELLIEKGITKQRKLRSRICYVLGNYFWKEESLDKAIENIKILDKLQINSEQDFQQYLQNEVNHHFDLSKEFPYQIQLINYNYSNSGALLIKFDHVLSDGLGIISFICSIADNYSEELFPQVMRNNSNNSKFFYYLIGFLLSPYYAIANYIEMKHPKRVSRADNPFKVKEFDGLVNYSISKSFKLKSVEFLRKKYNISFNDLLLSTISMSIQKYFEKREEKKFENDFVFCTIPIGNTKIPKNAEEVRLTNQVSSVFFEMKLIDKLEMSNTITKEVKKLINNIPKHFALNLLIWILNAFMPLEAFKRLGDSFCLMNDVTISNVPGPTKALYYLGKKCTKLIPIISTSKFKCFFPIISYDGSFCINFIFDQNLKINPKEFNDIFTDTLENLVNENK